MKKLLMLLIVGMFLISFVSALTFDNTKSYDVVKKEVTITNAFGLGGDLEKLTLKENTESCSGNCYAIKDITIYNKGRLIDGVKFISLKRNSKVDNYKFEIQTGTKSIEVIDYKNECSLITSKNGTKYDSCENIKVGSHFEDEIIWEDYDINKELDVGTYKIKLSGSKGMYDEVDWIVTAQGKEIDEWAIWGAYTPDVRWTMNNSGAGIRADTTGVYNWSEGTIPSYSSVINTKEGFGNASKFINSGGGSNWRTITNEDAPSPLRTGNNGTWVLWMNLSRYISGGNDHTIMGIDDSGYYNDMTLSLLPNGTLRGTTQIGSGSGTVYTVLGGTYNTTDRLNSWHMVAMTWNSTTWRLYIDDTMVGSRDGMDVQAIGTRPFTIMETNVGADIINTIDEIAIFSSALTNEQISDIFNGIVTPTATITYPANTTYNYSPTTLNYSSDGVDCWGSKNGGVDNSTHVACGVNISLTANEGSNNWTLWANSSSGIQTNATISFTVDTINPIVRAIHPYSIINYGYASQNMSLNYSITDTNINTCWYEYESVNKTIPCNANSTFVMNFSLPIRLWANDSINHLVSNLTNMRFYALEIANNYSTSILEDMTNTFTINLSLSSGYRITSAQLVYNNTASSATINNYATNFTYLSATATSPNIASKTNISFYWNLTFEDDNNIESRYFNQTVDNFAVDNCTLNSIVLFNFTMKDEDSQALINSTTDKSIIRIEMLFKNPATNITLANFTTLYNQTLPAVICSNTSLAGSTYKVDGIIQYSSGSRFNEFYHLQSYILNTSTTNQNITLYDLTNATGTEYKITYKDINFNTVPGALIQIQRKYVDEGVFKVVEIPKVGAAGYAIAHLVSNDAIYTMLVYQNGILLGAFDNIVAFCQNPLYSECEININSLSSTVKPHDFSDEGDFVSTLSWNKTSRAITSIFSVPSGASVVALLNVVQYDGLGNNTVCNDTLTSSGGTLSCTVPTAFMNSTVEATLYADGVIKRYVIFSLGTTPYAQFGANLLFLGITMFLFFIGISVSDDPKIMGFILILGVVTLGTINLITTTSWIGAGATILWFIAAVIIILVKGSDR